MSFSSSEAMETLMNSKDEKWNTSSRESLFKQKVTKLVRSESLCNIYKNFDPSLTFSQMKLRQLCLKNIKKKTPKCEIVDEKSRLPKMIQTRSLLKNELEILKINMSIHDRIAAVRQSQILKNFEMKTKLKKNKQKSKFSKRPTLSLSKCVTPKIKDLLTEIEWSESAKTDKVIWKFLKRGPSFKRDYANFRKPLLKIQTLPFPGSRFQNVKPIKVTCPNCMFFITTNIKKVSSIRTKLFSIIFGIIGLCIVPHVFYAFKDIVHLCPLCKIYLGFCPAFNVQIRKRKSASVEQDQIICQRLKERVSKLEKKMVSASSTSAKNLFVESKLRLSDRVQVNVNNIAAITRQIQRGSKANENLMAAAKNFALQEAAIENSETNLKKLKLLTTHINNQLDSLHNSSSKMEVVLEQVRSMQR